MARAKKKIHVALVYNPFDLSKVEKHELVYNKKFTLGNYMEGLPENVSWTIGYNGKAYHKKEEWENIVLKPEDKISLVVTPLGGGGEEGDDDKSILRMIAIIAVTVIAYYFIGPAALEFGGKAFAAIATATFTVAGVLLINAVLPPPGLTAPKKVSNTYGEDGPKNTSREGVVVPIVYGKYRVAGNIVDLYNKNVGDDQYLFMRTIINDGRVQSIGDIFINDQPLSNFTNVETRIELGNGTVGLNDWFGETVRPINRNHKLTTSNFTHTTTTNVDRVRLDLVFPRGLCKFGKNNSVNSHTVDVYAEYRAFGSSGAWSPLTQSNDIVFLRYNSPVGELPGYGYTPPYDGGNKYAYGDPTFYSGTSWELTNEVQYYGDYDIYTQTGPATTDLQGAIGATTPVGTTRVNMQVRAIVASDAVNSVNGTYNIQPAYRKVGDTTWTYIGVESGTVQRTSGNDEWSVFPTINRTVQFSVDPAFQYEVTTFGGSIITATATVNSNSSGLISITRAKDSTVRFSYESGILTRGRYDIRIRRATAESTDKTFADEVYLSDVNEIDLDNISYAGTANLSLKIKMTDQLSNVPNVTAMVEGSLVKKYDESGNVTSSTHYTRYPPYQVLDVLLNQERGRGFSPSRIDYSAFAEWERHCIEKGLESNIVFDTDSNVWDATMLLCRIGHGSIVKLGNKFSVIIDKASDPVMLFNDSNMFRDTFQTSWIPIIDRANEIHYTYYPESNDFKQEMLRVVDPDAINQGEALRVAQITQVGVTNLAQAKYDIEKQLRENKLIRKGVNFEAPLEAVGLMLGDVALIQHNSANYGRGVGTGRLKPGSTVSALALDAPVTIETGITYKALVILPSVKRYDVTIQSITGDNVFVTGLPTGTVARCRRLVQGTKDVSVVNIYDAAPHDKVICSDVAGLTTGAAQLWDTDVIEERTITNVAGEYTTVSLNAPLSVIPPEYGIYMIGPVEEITRPYRLRAITGDSIHRKKLDFVEYNAQVYAPLGASVTVPTPRPSRVSAHVTNLSTKQSLTIAGDISTTKVTLAWDRGDAYYGGADVYTRMDGRDWAFERTVQNVTMAEFPANVGESTEYRVVAYNNFGNRASILSAPSAIIYVNPTYETLVTPSALTINATYFKVDGTSTLAWTYPDYEKVAHYFEAQVLPVTLTQFNQFNASTWTPTDANAWVPATGIDNKTAKFAEQAVGYYIYRVRAVFGSAASAWSLISQNLQAPALPNTPTNITINNGTPSVSSASFASRDVSVSWLGVIEQSIPLTAIDENSVGYYWRDYVVTVTTVGGTVLRTTYTTDPFFNYTYDMNRADCIAAGITSVEANRQFVIKVGFRGYQGQISSEFSVTCTNATPAAPTPITTRVTPTSAAIIFANPVDSDYMGVKVWLSETNGFTPSSGNLVWDDTGTPILTVNPLTTYYARLALYDSFDKTNGLAVSSQFTFVTPAISATATTVPWSGVFGAGKPEDNATIGARVGTNLFPNTGSTPLPGTQILNSEIGIDANGRLTNTGTGTVVVGNAQITIDANGRLTTTGTGSAIVDNGKITIDTLGRLTTTGTGSVVVDNSKITLSGLGFTGATDATRNVVSTGLLSARPTGADGDLFFATDDNSGAGLLYTKIAGAWVADPKAKVLFDNLTTTVNSNEATNSAFRSAQASDNTAQATRLNALEATVDNGTTGLVATRARLITEETTRANADSALATRATTLESQMANTAGSGLQSRISTEETTRASADSALATRATVLESIAASGSPGANLVFNSALTSLDGYEVTSSGTGPFLRGLNLSNPTWGNSTNPTGYLNVSRTGVGSETVMDERSPRFRLRPNQRYGFAARLAPHRATASVRLEFLDASGAFLSNTSLITGGTEGGAGSGNPANFTTLGAFATAPANTAFGRVVVRLAGNGQNDPYVFWQAMDCFQASEGQTALRPHQDGPPLDRTADLVTATARIATEETTRASADSALAARATTLETTVNDGTTGLVATRARLITEETTRASADSALATRATTLEARVVADQQADYLSNGQFLRGTNGWIQVSGGGAVNSLNPEGLSGRNGVHITAASGGGVQYYGTEFAFPTWRALDLAWVGITSLWSGGTNTGASIRVYIQGKVGAGSYTTIANTAAFTDIDALTVPKTLRATAAAGYDTIRLLFEINPPSSGSTLGFILTQKVTNWTGEFPSLDAGPRAVLGTEARIGVEETTRANADSALASRSSTLEAVVRFPTPEAVNKNPTFSTWSGPSGTIPEDWLNWAGNGTINTKLVGDISPFAYRQAKTAGISANWGIYQNLPNILTQGWYVIEVDIRLNSGVLNGAGVYIQYGVSGITSSTSFGFWSEPDVNGTVHGAGTAGRRYRFAKLVQLVNTANLAELYAMTSWDGFGEVASSNLKDLTWHKCSIRPASDSEIELRAARGGASSVGARITTEETTRASADTALATRATALEAQMANTSGSGLQSRIATEESARASADAAQASQITTLTARANGNPNLFPYPTPITNRTPTQLGWTGTPISTIFAAFVGGVVYYKVRGSGGSAVNEAYIYDLPEEYYFQTGSSYTLSCYGYAGTGAVGDRVYAYLEFRSANNSTLLHASTSVTLNSISTRQSVTGTFPGAGTAGRLRVVFLREWPASGSYQDIVFNMIKVEAGTVATVFTNSAQIQTFASTSIDAYGRAYAISGTQTEVNGRKGGFVMDNDGAVTNFQITADDFRIYQSVGGSNIVPFRVVGGQTQINDALVRTLNVVPDGGGPSHRVQLRPNTATGADGASITFSPAYAGIPLIRPVILQPPALAAGETYDISATSLSASGFTIRAKKFTAGTPTAQSSGAGSNVGGTPQWRANKPTAADADGNSYTYTWTATLNKTYQEFFGGSSWYAEYYGEYDVYYNNGSGWVNAYSVGMTFESMYIGTPPATVTGQAGSTTAVLPAIGQHGAEEFGLHPTQGAITAFAGVTYTTTSQSSVVALPGNFTFDIFPPT